MDTFRLQLGNYVKDYVAYETTAPVDYDAFGTLTLHRHERGSRDPRWVLIQTEHEQYQTMRYQSGLYGTKKLDLDEVAGYATDKMFRLLIDKLGA